jgi:tetratricopeptide (TPR) repeat protein
MTIEISAEQLPKPASTQEPKTAKPERPEDTNVIERGPGQINISESRRAPANDSSVSENTYRIAQDKMKAGAYREAIRDFEAALSGSGKKALIHQLIGRCYTRLGEKAAAKQHFEAALSMYEAAGSKSAADAVRRELGLLG